MGDNMFNSEEGTVVNEIEVTTANPSQIEENKTGVDDKVSGVPRSVKPESDAPQPEPSPPSEPTRMTNPTFYHEKFTPRRLLEEEEEISHEDVLYVGCVFAVLLAGYQLFHALTTFDGERNVRLSYFSK